MTLINIFSKIFRKVGDEIIITKKDGTQIKGIVKEDIGKSNKYPNSTLGNVARDYYKVEIKDGE
jgi:small nuclear ribonucleoprotein (snRNP)-like protein